MTKEGILSDGQEQELQVAAFRAGRQDGMVRRLAAAVQDAHGAADVVRRLADGLLERLLPFRQQLVDPLFALSIECGRGLRRRFGIEWGLRFRSRLFDLLRLLLRCVDVAVGRSEHVSGRQEQEGLEETVCQQMEDRRDEGAHPAEKRHESQLADRRVGERSLDVRLRE